MDAKDTRACPYCREEILADASLCKHCHSSVKPERPTHGGTCPFCREQVNAEALKCKHCQSSIDGSDEDFCQARVFAMAPAMRATDDDYGQGCFWNCMKYHTGHGDDRNSPDLHRHCEQKCQVSMPTLVQIASLVSRYMVRSR